MRLLPVFILFFGCGLIYCGCTKPPHIHAGGNIEELGPVVQQVRLADNISPAFISDLQLDSVTGNGFRYPSGEWASYFSYHADPNMVLRALSKLAFPLRDRTVDVSYHEITTDEWNALRRTMGSYELSGANSFWDADPELYNIYASTKNEHHLLLIEKSSTQIMHRIASRRQS